MNIDEYIPIQDNVIIQSDPYFGPTTRSLYFSGPINYSNTKNIISELLQLNSISNKEIKLYVNTEGGSLTDSLAIYDVIKTIKAPVDTITQGLCASAGIVIFLAGRKRYTTENSMFFYHQPILRVADIASSEFSEDVSEAYSISRNLLDSIIKKTANINPTEWKNNFENKTFKYFTAQKAKQLNIATHIIKNKGA